MRVFPDRSRDDGDAFFKFCICFVLLLFAQNPYQLFPDDFGEMDRYGVSDLPQRLSPFSTDFVVRREGLDELCFSDGHVAGGPIWEQQHVLASRDAMCTSLDGFARFVDRATGVAGIGPGTVNENMVEQSVVSLWRREMSNCFSNGLPFRKSGVRKRPRPFGVDVRAQSDDEHSFANLRNSIVSRIQEGIGHTIRDTRFGRRCQIGQTLGVRLPGFSRLDHAIGETQSGQDVAEISGKTFSQKPFDVFEDKSSGAQLTDRSNRLGKHVTMVVLRLRETAKRKRLARRTSCNKVDARERRKIKGSDVRLVN